MKKLEVLEVDGIRYLESKEIAESIGKKHSDVLRSIRVACWQMAGCGIKADGFFREAVYKDAHGQERPCFLVTKAGCTILSSRASGRRGESLQGRIWRPLMASPQSCRIRTPASGRR